MPQGLLAWPWNAAPNALIDTEVMMLANRTARSDSAMARLENGDVVSYPVFLVLENCQLGTYEVIGLGLT